MKKIYIKRNEIIHPGVGEEQHEELHGWSWVLHYYVPGHTSDSVKEIFLENTGYYCKIGRYRTVLHWLCYKNPVERSFHNSQYVLIFKIAKPECKTTSTIAATASSQVERLRG